MVIPRWKKVVEPGFNGAPTLERAIVYTQVEDLVSPSSPEPVDDLG
jgi:hypothetical protein